MSAVMKEQENQIVEFDEFESKLIEFREKYDDVVYDLSDPDQDKQARSDKYSIGKIISSLDSKHKELKAPLKIRTDLIDGKRKEIKDQLLDVQGKIKSQIDSHEKAIAVHAEELQRMVDEVNELGVFVSDHTGNSFIPDSNEINRRLSIMKKIDVDDSFEDRKADAALAQIEVTKSLEALLELALKTEQEAAELEAKQKAKEEKARQAKRHRNLIYSEAVASLTVALIDEDLALEGKAEDLATGIINMINDESIQHITLNY